MVTARVPDLMEPLIGYRWWTLSGISRPPSEWRLTSAYDTTWEPYVASAAKCFCRQPTRPCPTCPSPYPIAPFGGGSFVSREPFVSPYYPCGFYAWRSLPALYDGMGEYGPLQGSSIAVCGRVSLWGLVQPHEYGYRAEFAYPRSLLAVCLGGSRKAILPDGRVIEDRGLMWDAPDDSHSIARQLAEVYGIPYEFSQEVVNEHRNFTTSNFRRAAYFSAPGSGPATIVSNAIPGPGPTCPCPSCQRAREDAERYAAGRRAGARLKNQIFGPWSI